MIPVKVEIIEEEIIYDFKDNFTGLEFLTAQDVKLQDNLRMTIRGAIAAMNGKKMSYKDVVSLPYLKFMNFIAQFNKKYGMSAFLSKKR